MACFENPETFLLRLSAKKPYQIYIGQCDKRVYKKNEGLYIEIFKTRHLDLLKYTVLKEDL